jgi:hypothetical protein
VTQDGKVVSAVVGSVIGFLFITLVVAIVLKRRREKNEEELHSGYHIIGSLE